MYLFAQFYRIVYFFPHHTGDFNLNIGSMTSYPDADFSNLGNTLKKQKVYHKKPLLKRSPILQCDMCGEECKGYIRLKEHFILMHPGKRPFICPVCGRRFRKKDSIKTCQHSGKEQVEHKCKTCGEIFWSKKKLRRHKKQTHDIHAPKIPCMLCDEVFDQNRDLHNHMAIHADSGEILKCKICQRSFNKPSVLRKHLMKHSKSKTCRICGKTFMSVFSLRNHQKFHLGKFSCHLCGRFMSSTWNLKQHMKTHIRSEKTYECNVCHEKFFSPSALEFHKSSFHSIGKRHNKCPVCSKVFRSSFGRNSHLMTHTEEERTLHQAFVPMYTCIICGETMRAEYKFKHLKRHMSKAEEMFVCETCGKSFSQYSDLKLHITKHKPEEQESEDLMTEEEREFFKTLSTNNHLPCKQKPISNQRCDCDICWKNSLNKPCIGLHILANTNSDNNPILCDVCGKSFKSKTYLNTHMKLHSGNLPFQCEICRRGFLSKYSLECHLVSHLNEKPYTCHVCGIKFCSEANMQRHIKVKHEKQQQFKCEVCLKYFTTKQGLIVHKRMHTGEKPYMCDMCGHSFADPSTFYKHKASHTKKYIYAKRNFESLN